MTARFMTARAAAAAGGGQRGYGLQRRRGQYGARAFTPGRLGACPALFLYIGKQGNFHKSRKTHYTFCLNCNIIAQCLCEDGKSKCEKFTYRSQGQRRRRVRGVSVMLAGKGSQERPVRKKRRGINHKQRPGRWGAYSQTMRQAPGRWRETQIS